ncbi:hypothetical protein D3C74_398890 [compost metagenome]
MHHVGDGHRNVRLDERIYRRHRRDDRFPFINGVHDAHGIHRRHRRIGRLPRNLRLRRIRWIEGELQLPLFSRNHPHLTLNGKDAGQLR